MLEAEVQLSLESRQVGRVTIVRCQGRIIAGKESESLRDHISWVLRDRRYIVLHLGEVPFIDSSGIGTMVRALATTRQTRGDLKLCNVPENIRKVLEMTRLTSVFDLHDSEETAVGAFYGSDYAPGGQPHSPLPAGRAILCIDSNLDVLAYLRELLRRAGYEVQSTNRASDALLLMRVTRFDLLLVGPDKIASPSSPQAFRDACSRLPVIELGNEFSTLDAGDAATGLLEKIRSQFDAKSA